MARDPAIVVVRSGQVCLRFLQDALVDHFWLTDEQFAKIAPHLPTGARGKERMDDRRVISGMIHVLKSGGRWSGAPREWPRRARPAQGKSPPATRQRRFRAGNRRGASI